MTIEETVRNGRPLEDILIIDSHCHMGSCNFKYDISSRVMINTMNRLGIRIACVSHNASLKDHKWGNDRSMEAAGEYPGRFVIYCAINPFYPEEIPSELDRCFLNSHVKGIKIIPQILKQTMAHKNYIPVYEYAAQKRCPVLVHVYSMEEVRNMDKLASEYPEAVFIMAHIGGEIENMEKAIDVINRHDNIYGDFAVSRGWEGNVEWLVSEVGSGKLLYGSDMPGLSPFPTVSRIAFAEITEEEKRDILGLNIKKLLKL